VVAAVDHESLGYNQRVEALVKLRFSLSQLLLGISLVAILFGFTQSEGCGNRYAMIETLSFSSDDTRLLATKLTARDAQTPLKFYKADVSRTISWFNASTGASQGIVHQDLRRGNCGPAFGLWWIGRKSAICQPSNDGVTMSAFGGGDVTIGVGTHAPKVVPLKHEAYNIAVSKTGRFMAASGFDQVTVVDTQREAAPMEIQTRDAPFLHASRLAFSNDETRLIVVGDTRMNIWDIPSAKRVGRAIQTDQADINSICAAPDDTIIVCSENWVRRYTFDGQIVATLGDSGAYQCCISGDGTTLAVGGLGRIKIYEVKSNALRKTIPFGIATALALSRDGRRCAAGGSDGVIIDRVILADTASGNRLWYANPPGRYQPPWTLPATFLVGWLYFAVRSLRAT
jgi:hypothetical protein